MDRIWLVSVPHTGTMYTQALLERAGFHVRQTHCMTVGGGWVGQGRKVVVPWRDPCLAKISELNRFDERKANADSPRYPQVKAADFATVLGWQDLPNVYVFHVGVPTSLAELALFVGRPLDFSLGPVNTSEDRTGLKARYLAGEKLPELAEFQREYLAAAVA